MNGFEVKFCRRCGRALSLEVVMEQEKKEQDSLTKLREAMVVLSKDADYETREKLKSLLS